MDAIQPEATRLTRRSGSWSVSAADGRRLFFGALLLATLAPFALILGVAPHVGRLPGLGTLILLTGVGHVASTLYLYGDREFRPLVRRNWVPFIAAPLGLAAAFGLIWFWVPAIWPGVFLGYFCWLLYHYQRQSYGIVAFASKAANLRPPAQLLRALDLTVVAGILGLVASGAVGLPHLAPASAVRLVGGLVYAGALAL